MTIEVRKVESGDELELLVGQINNAQWDEEDDPDIFTPEALQAYLEKQDTVFVVCHSKAEGGNEFLGMASARVEFKPYRNSKWLYVDEVDVCSDQRKKGVGTALMQALIVFGEERGCEELWLAAEKANVVANKFYEALEPGDIAPCIGYAFELVDRA